MFKIKNTVLSLSLIGLSSFLVSCEDDRYENYDSTPSGSTEFTPSVNESVFAVEVAVVGNEGQIVSAVGHPFVAVPTAEGSCPSDITTLDASMAIPLSLKSNNVATFNSGTANDNNYCVTNTHTVSGGQWIPNDAQINGCSYYWTTMLTFQGSSVVLTKENASIEICL